MLIYRMLRSGAFAGLALVALALGACGRLPDVAALVAAASTSGRMPTVIDASGAVSEDRQHAVLRELLSAGPAPGMLAQQLRVAAAISPAPLVLGNRVTLLADGPAIERAIREAVSGARDHIDIETYILADDAVGREFADLLIRKRAEHVAVNLTYDGLASRGTSNAFFERLRSAGVHLLEFNPIDPFGTRVKWSPSARDHRKVFIADGYVAIIGCANVELPREVEGETWRDTDIRVEGPAVAQFQALFAWKSTSASTRGCMRRPRSSTACGRRSARRISIGAAFFSTGKSTRSWSAPHLPSGWSRCSRRTCRIRTGSLAANGNGDPWSSD